MIAFWDRSSGLATGGEHRPRALLATSDGGRTFQPVLKSPSSVIWITTAGMSDAWAVIQLHCSRARGHKAFLTIHSDDRGVSWHALSGTRIERPVFASADRGLTMADSAENALFSTSDGGRTWKRIGGPCEGWDDGTVSYPSPRNAWAVCGAALGAGAEYKSVYRARKGGRDWHRLVVIDGKHKRSHGLTLGGYPYGLSFSAAGFGVLLDGYPGPINLSRDAGRNWQFKEHVVGDSVSVFSKRGAFLINYHGNLVRTTDAGRKWTVAHTWTP